MSTCGSAVRSALAFAACAVLLGLAWFGLRAFGDWTFYACTAFVPVWLCDVARSRSGRDRIAAAVCLCLVTVGWTLKYEDARFRVACTAACAGAVTAMLDAGTLVAPSRSDAGVPDAP